MLARERCEAGIEYELLKRREPILWSVGFRRAVSERAVRAHPHSHRLVRAVTVSSHDLLKPNSTPTPHPSPPAQPPSNLQPCGFDSTLQLSPR